MRRPSSMLFSLCLLFAGSVAAQQRPGRPPAAAESEAPRVEVRMISLKYTQAHAFSEVLQNVIGGEPGTRIAVDTRTNSVIVSAPPNTLKTAETLAQALDSMEVPEVDQPHSRIFTVPKERHNAVMFLLNQQNIEGILSARGDDGTIIVTGKKAALEKMASIIGQAETALTVPPMRVRVLWLVSGTAEGVDKLPAPPKDLDSVVQELSRLGIEKPRMAAQTLVNGSLGQDLEANGSLTLPFANRFFIYGQLNGAPPAAPSLQIRIEVLSPPEAGGGGAKLATQLTTPLGHYVVLGVTPTESLTSVFVVQVTAAESNQPQVVDPAGRPKVSR
jgi:type II/III secretion system protein